MTIDPADPHDLRPTEEASIETVQLAVDGMTKDDSVQHAAEVLRKMEGVKEVHGENASGLITVTFDARKTHVPALHDGLLQAGYTPAPTATN